MTMTPYEALELLADYENGGSFIGYGESIRVLRSALEWHTEPPEKAGWYWSEVKYDKVTKLELSHYNVKLGWYMTSTSGIVTRWTYLPTPPEE